MKAEKNIKTSAKPKKKSGNLDIATAKLIKSPKKQGLFWFFGRNAQSQYISWLLIFSMVIGLSYILYNWSIDQASARAEEIEKRSNPVICNEAGISVDGVCQDYKSININITNTNNLDLKGFRIKSLGLYPDEEDYAVSEDIDYEIDPGVSEKISILKKRTVSQITIIPIAQKGKKDILCEDKSIVLGDIKQC